MAKGFKCTRCGECCHSPRLSKKDIERIRKSGYKEEDFVYIDEIENMYIRDENDWCMFLNKGKAASCKIYEARPKICRLYPSELINESCKPEKLAFDAYMEKKWRKEKE